ncbi:ComEC/Rec2 family competence protein [Alphaproteobacteria bacterium endosymbiont of Tiliacea citrago]|uniref:ComEC/Rec2 family competence protein n=1 Tax=Alphaproteobacteria bacterium endosymbiont of Tiliacea citrago TaxID=3077944 RepID=UPI00313C2904
MVNIYQLQSLAPIFLTAGLYLGLGIKSICFLISIFTVFYKKITPKIRRILIFFLLGCIRGLFKVTETNYSYRYTSFQADIIDYQIREKANYLLLKNFKYIPKTSFEYELDKYPSFPKEAIMAVDDLETLKNAGKIEAIGRFHIPMQFMNDRRMKPRGVIKTFKIKKTKNHNLKNYLREKFHTYLSLDAADFCCAIFLSDTFSISKERRKVYEKAGLSHVLGVSILNLSVVLILLFYIFYFMIGTFYLKSAFTIPLFVSAQLFSIFSIVIYCYLVGFEYPLLRTLFMSSVSLFMLFNGRKNDVESVLLTASIILMINPEAIYDLSFQLSFGGVLGIYSLNKNIKNKVLSSFWTTLSAMSLIGPISIFQFKQICLQPFLSNLITTPLLSFLITPSLLIYIFLPSFLAKYFALIINYEFIFFEKLIIFLSKTAGNIHFLPVFYLFFVVFLSFFLIFSIIKERVRYVFLALGYLFLLIGIIRAYNKKPFVLVNASMIALVLKDKIYVYPKSGKNGEILSEYYNLPVYDGKDIGVFKEDCGKIIINDIGIVRSGPKGCYCLNTKKDYVFLPEEIIDKTQKIVLF